MNVGRFFSWTVLAGMAIAGGLVVSDQRVIPSSRFNAPPINSGLPLRLGVVLSDTSGTMGMNQVMTHTLLLARDRVNQCGGINQTPVFLAMDHVAAKTATSDEVTSTQPQYPNRSQEAIAQEFQAMSRLIQAQDIHGVITALTVEPASHGLISEALDTAIDFNVPTVSPTNTQPLLVKPDDSPFDRFRQNVPKVDTRKQGNRYTGFMNDVQLQAKKTKYWSRTIMSDRQHLMMVAQLAHQQGWNRIVTLGPDTDRGKYLEYLLSDALKTWNRPSILPEQSLHYKVKLSSSEPPSSEPPSSESTSSESPSSEPTPETIALGNLIDLSALESHRTAPVSIDVELDTDSLATQSPDAIIVFLEPGMFSDIVLTPHPTPPSDNAVNQESRNEVAPNQNTSISQSNAHLNAIVPKASLLPVSGSVPQAPLTGQQDPLPPIATTLVNQLRTVADLNQTPVILGNWLDIDILLTQVNEMGESTAPLTHPMTGLRGILSRPALSPYHVLAKDQRNGNLNSPLLFKSAIVHSTWDAVVLMMLAAEAAGYNHKDAIQNNLRNVANPPGTEVTDVCEALTLLRQGQSINYQGLSGRVDLNGWGDVNPPQTYKVWQITPTGGQKTIETLEWLEPSSTSTP